MVLVPLLTWVPLAIKGLDLLIKGQSLAKAIQFKKSDHSFWITLNVGGKEFLTTRRTLLAEENTLFEKFVISEEEVERKIKEDEEKQNIYFLMKKYSGLEYYIDWRKKRIQKRLDEEAKNRKVVKVIRSGGALLGTNNIKLLEFEHLPYNRFEKKKAPAPVIEIVEESEEDIIIKVQMQQFENQRKEEQKKLLAMKLLKIRQENPNRYRVDRDPEHFRVVLNYLRYGKLITNHVSKEGILEEAKFFEVQSLVDILTTGKTKRKLNPLERLEEELIEDEVELAAQLDDLENNTVTSEPKKN